MSSEEVTFDLLSHRKQMDNFRLRPATSCLLLVDLQYGSASREYGFGRLYSSVGHAAVVNRYVERIETVVVPSVQKLQHAFRAAGAPIIYATVGTLTGTFQDMTPRFGRAAQYWRDNGFDPPYARLGSREMTVLDEIAPAAGEPVIAKSGASAFTSSPIERLLFGFGTRQLVIGGVATSYCVESTLRDACDRGFDCVLVEDACADLQPEIHDMGIRSSSQFCRVSDADAVVGELGRVG